MFKYTISYKIKSSFDSKLIKKIKDSLSAASKILKLPSEINYFEIIIVGDCKIKSLNKLYRDKDKVTDVISLAYNMPFTTINNSYNHLGEIYIDYKQSLRQSKQYSHSIDREICFLIIHGLLHLIGYDHIDLQDEKVMFSLQDEILDMANIRR